MSEVTQERRVVGQPLDLEVIAANYGGDWCDCIDSVLEHLNPRKLAGYCIAKGYENFPAPVEDDLGVRYGYRMASKKETFEVDGERQERTINLVAAFGDFSYRPHDTLQSVLNAIKKVAEFEQRPPQKVAEDVAQADDSKVPEPKQARADIAEQIYVPQTRRFQQSSDGTMRPI